MTDIEIAQSAEMQVINKIADKIGIPDKYVENYGKYKAKVDYRYLQNELKDKEDGKLILLQLSTLHRQVKVKQQQQSVLAMLLTKWAKRQLSL